MDLSKAKKRLRYGLIFLLSAAIFVRLSLPFSEIILVKTTPLPPSADCIVLLSGGSKLRIEKAVALYNKQIAPVILVSGGPYLHTSEAALIKEALLRKGIPEHAIMLETQATSTYENALYTCPILHHSGFESIVLVTSGYHSRRAFLTFTERCENIDVFLGNAEDHIDYSKWWRQDFALEIVSFELQKTLWYLLNGRF